MCIVCVCLLGDGSDCLCVFLRGIPAPSLYSMHCRTSEVLIRFHIDVCTRS